jgi:hypothetical protein
MGTILARLRTISRRTVGLAALVIVVLAIALAGILDSTDSALGLVELALYIAGILALSAAVTYGVIKVSPAKSKSKSAEPS